VTFNPRARLDPTQVIVRKRPGRGGLVGAGGGIGIILVTAFLLLGGDPGVLLLLGGARDAVERADGTQLTDCQTGADANARTDCRIVGFVNSIQAYWTDDFKKDGQTYQPAQTILYTDATGTSCGDATSDVGPFYCSADVTVYIDLGFFDQLHSEYGAEEGPLAEAYVVAHEYGHHVQDLEGRLTSGGGGEGAEGGSVRTELQADCLAGVWVHNAASTGFLQPPTTDQVGQALSAAGAVGDDRIQQKAEGHVNPETWTHGSADERQHWFTAGLDSGSKDNCDTFSGPI
jgi:hypothetical protein